MISRPITNNISNGIFKILLNFAQLHISFLYNDTQLVAPIKDNCKFIYDAHIIIINNKWQGVVLPWRAWHRRSAKRCNYSDENSLRFFVRSKNSKPHLLLLLLLLRSSRINFVNVFKYVPQLTQLMEEKEIIWNVFSLFLGIDIVPLSEYFSRNIFYYVVGIGAA